MSEVTAVRRAAIVRAGVVENVILVGEGFVAPEGYSLAEDAGGLAQIGGTYDGVSFGPVPPAVVDPQAAAAAIEAQLDRDLDDLARSWGYSDSTRLTTYANSSNAKWQAEALAFLAGRDAWWTKAAQIYAAWQAGDPVPTYEAVRSQMPPIERPQ